MLFKSANCTLDSILGKESYMYRIDYKDKVGGKYLLKINETF